MTDAERKQVVIIGGGFGGLQAAMALKSAPVDVTLIDRENHHLFQPLLYQVATASLAPGSIAAPIRSVLGGQKNARVLLAEATGVNLDRREVELATGAPLAYDYLIVAAGAKTNYFGQDQWAEHAHGLKDMRDAIRIRERVLLAFEAAEREPDPAAREAMLTFVVIGGGPTGVEMAGAISELGRQVLAADYRNVTPQDIRVVLVEMADRVLTPFHESLSYSAKQQLEQLGVELILGQRVTDVSEDGVQLGDQFIECAVVCWATGVKPVSLAEKMGVTLDRGGRIRVDQKCAVLGHPEVFAVGDIASFIPEGEEYPLPGLAPVAMQQGRHVAAQIKRELKRKPRQEFRYRDKGIMATIGRSRAVVEAGAMRMSGLLAWLAWLFIHILYLIGFHNRIVVLFEWTWSYLTFKRGARLITAHIKGRREPIPGPEPLDVKLHVHRDHEKVLG